MRGENITTPVLVVTGFGDFESARMAGRLGANEFRNKPLFIDELEMAVKRLLHNPSPYDSDAVGHGSGHERRGHLAWLASLLEMLHASSRESRAGGVTPNDPKLLLVASLIRGLANPTLPQSLFLACALALRRTIASDERGSVTELTSNVEILIYEALGRSGAHDSRVVRALEMVRCAATRHERLTIERIADVQRIDPAHLGRLIKSETGFGVTDWRAAFLLRPSIPTLIETDEDVKQIARRQGMSH